MRHYFYISPQNEQKGPIEGGQLPAYGVTAQTMVWTQGMPQWMPAGQVEELLPVLSHVAPAAPQMVPPPQMAAAPQMMAAPQMAAAPQAPQSVTYIQTAPGYAPQQQPMMPKPGSNMVLAVLSTLFCCLPTGIYAIICASQVDGLYRRGDYAGAVSKANSARNWSIIGAVASVVISILYLIFYGAAVFAALGNM